MLRRILSFFAFIPFIRKYFEDEQKVELELSWKVYAIQARLPDHLFDEFNVYEMKLETMAKDSGIAVEVWYPKAKKPYIRHPEQFRLLMKWLEERGYE